MNPFLIARREGAVLVLSNQNVAARNALTPEFSQGVAQALREAAKDPDIGAIVLTGEGGHFCAGGDLRQLATRRTLAEEARRERLEILHDLIRAVHECPKPVVAAVEGAAAGAGLSLALACDLLVCATDAVFSVAYVKVGLTPDGGATAFLSEFLSRQVLTELCLSGDRISGERLHGLGAVNRLVDPGQALETAVSLAATLAQGPELAMGRIKALCRQAHANSLADQLEQEARFMVVSQGTEESREGMGAFLEKRQPNYARLRQGHSSTSSDRT